MTFGSDPEFFVVKDGVPVSAIGIVKGDIEHRIKMDGHEFYYDNVLAECAIKPGATKEEVLQNFEECISIYLDLVRPCTLETRASYVFPDSELNTEAARKAGCAPDTCAYDMELKTPPVDAIENGNLRSSGGHIHVGDELLISDGHEPWLCVYMWDLLLGVPSLYLDKDESSKVRRTIYGQPGRYRVKPYGIEYRTLSSFWLRSPRLVGLIYDLTQLGLEVVRSGEADKFWTFDFDKFLESDKLSDAWTCHGYDVDKLRKGINESDKSLVEEHFKIARKLMPPALRNELDECINEKWAILEVEWQGF